ncbi:MAG: hypothetical protein AAB403_06890 [Planctomycetota bacterium]
MKGFLIALFAGWAAIAPGSARSEDIYFIYSHVPIIGANPTLSYYDLNLKEVKPAPNCSANVCINRSGKPENETPEALVSFAMLRASLRQERNDRLHIEETKKVAAAINALKISMDAAVKTQLASIRADLVKRIEDIPKDLARDDAAYNTLKARLQQDLAQVFEPKK